ncbi:hypothetical protein C0991_009212 [Blastosporella zonata]|nr:hypothetical protein C0991_009212 [Blastosporella zonata]
MKILVVYLVEASNVTDLSAPLGPVALSTAMGDGMATGLRITVNNTGEKESNVEAQEKKLRKRFASVYRFRNSRDSAWAILRGSDLPVVELSILADILLSAIKSRQTKPPPAKAPLFSRLFKGW